MTLNPDIYNNTIYWLRVREREPLAIYCCDFIDWETSHTHTHVTPSDTIAHTRDTNCMS